MLQSSSAYYFWNVRESVSANGTCVIVQGTEQCGCSLEEAIQESSGQYLDEGLWVRSCKVWAGDGFRGQQRRGQRLIRETVGPWKDLILFQKNRQNPRILNKKAKIQFFKRDYHESLVEWTVGKKHGMKTS